MKQANYINYIMENDADPVEKSYLNTTHKCNLTGSQISTILYYLDVAFSNISEDIIPRDINTIYSELQSVTDNYYAQLEEEN